MMRWVFLFLGFGAPSLAMILIAGFSWFEAHKERRRTVALRHWLRAQG